VAFLTAWYSAERGSLKDPKIIFAVADLKECGIEVTAEWNGYGLSKLHTLTSCLQILSQNNFSHLTIQEFLCTVYISTLSQEEQHSLLIEFFYGYS